MTIPKIANAMGHIDDDLISGAVKYKHLKTYSWIKWAATAACLCLVIIGMLTAPLNGRYYYTPWKYDVVADHFANRLIPRSFEELEDWTRYLPNGEENPYGVIVECTVTGPSINRIIEPYPGEREPGKIYGKNHVLTPVRIKRILYAGEKTALKKNEIYLILEPFFYIEKSAWPYYNDHGGNKIYTVEYTPLQKGYRYIAYLDLSTSETYAYKGNTILRIPYRQESVYCLGSERTAKRVTDTSDPNYWDLWKSVMENYR
jgi:hypothetical protein